MLRGQITRLSLQLFLLDLLLTPVSLWLASELRARLPFGRGGALPAEAVEVPWFVYVLALIFWSSSLIMNSAYDPQRVLRWYDETARLVVSGIFASAMLAGALYIVFREMSRLQFVYFFIINLGMLLGYRALLRIYYRLIGRSRPGWGKRVIIAGCGDLGQKMGRVLLDHSRWGFHLVGYLDDNPLLHGRAFKGAPVLGSIDELPKHVTERKVDEVWVALPACANERINHIVMDLEALPVQPLIIPNFYSLALVRAKAELIAGIPLIGLREPMIRGKRRMFKRIFDIVIGGMILLLLSPVMLLIALGIRIDSKGPVIFRQKRVGENGRPFDMHKFRSMVADAEEGHREEPADTQDRVPIHKRRGDFRITGFGLFLRRYSLDELPQLLNVLKGEMSLVGPRPEMPWLVEKYEPWQRRRFAVPQGMTGWWQINGRSDKPMHLNTEVDLYYVYNHSFWLDLWILFRTPIAVLRGGGAY